MENYFQSSCSLDLTALDLFLCGTFKNVVYQKISIIPKNMGQQIIVTCAGISLEMMIREMNYEQLMFMIQQ